MPNRTIILKYVGPSYAEDIFPDIQVEVIRETANFIWLRHKRLGSKEVKFSRKKGFSVGTEPTFGIGRTGYKLPREEWV